MAWPHETKAYVAALEASAVFWYQDVERMIWLEKQTVNVRTPLPHGSRDLFWASPDDDEPSALRSQIDARFQKAQPE